MASVPSRVQLMITLAAFAVMFGGHQSAQGATLNAGAGLDEGFLFFNNQNGIFTPVPKGVAGTVGPNPLGGIEALVSDVFQTNIIPVAPGEPPSSSGLTYHFAGNGVAFANFGQIGAGAFFDVSMATPALFFQDLGPGRTFSAGGASASASFDDTVTITSQKGTNVRMVFTIGGSLVLCVPESALNCNPDIVDPTMSFGVVANGTPVGNVSIDRKGSHGPFFDPLTGQLTTNAIPISGPIDLATSIEAQVGFVGLNALSNSFTTAGTVDFAQTATLSGIEVFDANGNPVSDFTVSSQSGTHYPLSTPAIGVPEPGTAALLLCGAMSLAAMRCVATRKRRLPEPDALTLLVVGFVAWAAARASGKCRNRSSVPFGRRAQLSPTSSRLAFHVGKWMLLTGMLTLALTSPATVHAGAFTWSGAGNVWSAPGNWTPEGVPKMAGDTATITAGGSNGISLDIDPTLDSFTMNSAAKSLSITGHTITVTGPSTVDAGFIQLNNGTWASAAPPNSLQLNGNARLSATGDSSITNLGIVKGSLTVSGSGTDGATLTIGNSLLNSGSVTLTTNAAGKQTVLNVQGLTQPNFVNTGTVTFQGTAGSLKVRGSLVNGSANEIGSIVVNASATIEGQTDTIHQNNVKGSITIAKDTVLTFTGQSLRNLGTITGKGTLDARQLTAVNPKGVINSGFLKPGSSPGIFTIDGDYTQMPDGMLGIELAGPLLNDPITGDTDYGQLVVTGSAKLDGLLNVSLVNGFLPDPSATFDVLVAQGGLDGVFSNASSILETPFGTFDVSYLGSPSSPSIVRLSDFTPTPVPEPSTLLLLGSALGGLLLWKRRQRVGLAVMVCLACLVSINLGVAFAITIEIDEFQHATVLLPFAPQQGTLFLCENSSAPLSPVTCEAPPSDTVVFLSDINTGSALLESDLPEPGEPAAPGDRALLIPFPAPFFSVGEPGGENTTQTLVYTPTRGQPGFALVQGIPVSYAITSDVVPEPATWLLLGSGIVGLALRRRRQFVVNLMRAHP